MIYMRGACYLTHLICILSYLGSPAIGCRLSFSLVTFVEMHVQNKIILIVY